MSLLSSLTAVPTLSVLFDRQDTNVFFLYPTAPGEIPIADTRVQGSVTLHLPSDRTVSNITLELLGAQRFWFKGRQRTVETLRLGSLLKQDVLLNKGKHEFTFDFAIPSTTAPTMLNELGGVTYFLYCRIPNLGRMGSILETERKLAFIVNHSGQNDGLAPAHQMEKQLLHHRFGPMLVELSSKHLMIGGFCRFYLTWTATSLPFKIVDLVVEIVQKVGIKPSLDTLGPIETATIRKTIWSLGEEKEWTNILKGVVYPQDQKIAVSRQARILSGFSPKGALNASHHPYSRSCVMPSTEIVLTLTYEQYEGGTTPNQQQLSQPTLQELQIRSPACLSSCWCLLEYYRLPAYEAEKIEGMRIGEPNNTLPKGPYGFSRCLCAYRELEDHEERDYGVSRAEVEEQWKAEQDGRAWTESVGHKRDDALPVASS